MLIKTYQFTNPQRNYDIVIKANDDTLLYYYKILLLKSKYFHNMLYGSYLESLSSNEIKLERNSEALNIFLNLILYSNSYPIDELDHDILVELLDMSEEYIFEDIKEYLIDFINKEFSDKLEVFALLSKYNMIHHKNVLIRELIFDANIYEHIPHLFNSEDIIVMLETINDRLFFETKLKDTSNPPKHNDIIYTLIKWSQNNDYNHFDKIVSEISYYGVSTQMIYDDFLELKILLAKFIKKCY